MGKKGPPGLMAERTIRGMLNGLAKQLNTRMPSDRLVKVLEAQARLEGQLRQVEKIRLERELKKQGDDGAKAA